MSTILIICLLIAQSFATDLHLEEIASRVNANPNSSWKAKVIAKFKGLTLEDAQVLCGLKGDAQHIPLKRATPNFVNGIPPTFDAREQWPQCSSIGTIRDQEGCGSCYAFAATEALADRFCIMKGINVTLSPQNIVDCDKMDAGCGGGLLDNVWKFLKSDGVVTEDCVPYQGSPEQCPFTSGNGTCADGSSATFYYADSIYGIYPSQEALMTEIYKNGPIEVGFFVYSDFMTYSTGVYQKTSGSSFVGQHAVKILGWGNESNVPYWLVANSWGPTWGENGFFKILRGNDECGIEQLGSAGLPGNVVTKSLNKPIVKSKITPPSFPPQFSSQLTYGSSFSSTNGTWYYDFPNQRQRIEFYVLKHNFVQLYLYQKSQAYFFYSFFDSFVCYLIEIPSATLPTGIPSNATYSGNTTCPNGDTCEYWIQYFPYTTLSFTYDAKTQLLASLTAGPSPFSSMDYEFSNYTMGAPDESLFVPPNVPCFPYPGSPLTPPPKFEKFSDYFEQRMP